MSDEKRIARTPEDVNPKYAERISPKPSSTWEGGRGVPWWAKVTQYGCKYKCAYCGKESLGIGDVEKMHWIGCPNDASPWRYMPKGKKSKSRFSGRGFKLS